MMKKFLERLKNKKFLLVLIGLILILIGQLGFGDLIPENTWKVILTIVTILVVLGIVEDPDKSRDDTIDDLFDKLDEINKKQEDETLEDKTLEDTNETVSETKEEE